MRDTALNWMQEQRGVFVVATANDVRQLAPEQIRRRFSQVVFVDLPTPEDPYPQPRPAQSGAIVAPPGNFLTMWSARP
jgi:hypothetical protein